jgi:hypothetical protein
MRKVLGLILVLVLPSAAHAFGDCSNPAYMEGFPGVTAAAACEERAKFPLTHGRGTSKVRVISFTSGAHGDDAVWTARVERNLAAIGAAMRSMGTVGTDDISVLLASSVSEEGWEGEATPVRAGRSSYRGECAITVYKVPEGYSERQFDFLLAHEIFHCAQFATFPGPVSAEGAEWWIEGSAEHFAHMAVPDAGDFGWYQGYDAGSVDKALTALTYENVVFFHWLHQQRGPEGVAAFLAAMPTGGDQIAALRARIDTSAWASFIEALVEGRITSPGGTGVPRAEYFTGNYEVGDTTDLPVTVSPFVAQRYKVRFKKERHYDVGLSGADGTQVRMQDDGATWSNLPLFVSTCPDAVTRILYSATADAAVAGRIDFEKVGVEGQGACCLEGEWTPTEETLAGLATFGNEIGGPALAMSGGDMSCSYDGGGALLTFRGDGAGELAFDGHSTSCVARMHGQSMTTTGTRSGTFAFNWTAKGDGAGMADYTDNTVIWTMAIKMGPVMQSMTNPDAGPSVARNGFAFTCTPATLDIQGIYGLSHTENHFTRPEPAP